MSVEVNGNKELGEAIKRDEAEIEICDPKTGKCVLRIKAVGTCAWIVCIGGVAAAIIAVALMSTPEPVTKTLGLAGGGAAVAILGPAYFSACCTIAIAGGGVGALNKLRNYSLHEMPNGHILLKKR